MPEGDSIHQVRLSLKPILEDRTVSHFWAKKIRGHRPRAGQHIDAVRVHGKHLLIDFAPALTLQIHLGLSGWWQVHPGEPAGDLLDRLRRNPRLRVFIGTDLGAAACYSAPTIQTYVRDVDSADVPVVADAITPLSNLGPDLRVDDGGRQAVAQEAVRRLRARSDPAELIADALLEQQLAAGIGNVYKSEVLFIHRVWPFTPVADLDDAQLARLFTTASRLLWINSQRPDSRRTTTPFSGSLSDLHGGVYVYRRRRGPCRRCQTPIERAYTGRLGRSTYWCPRCQPIPEISQTSSGHRRLPTNTWPSPASLVQE